MKKVVKSIVISLYVLITIIVTYCLLSYNKYNIAEFKNKYLLIIENKEYNYKKSDLLIIKKTNNYQVGDAVFYYDIFSSPTVKVKIDKIKDISKTASDIYTYTLENNENYSSDSFLGITKDTKAYTILGTIYSILTSKIGYLIIIILPILTAFVYEIYAIIKEIKK